MKNLHTFNEFLTESRLWNPSMNKLLFGRGGNGTSKEYLEHRWKTVGSSIPSHFFEEANSEKNKSKKEELIKKLGLMNDSHNTEEEALKTGEYLLEMWKNKNNR